MKSVNCHIEVREDTSGYPRLWLVPVVPFISARMIECIDDTTVRLAKRISTLIESAIGSAIADFSARGSLENAYKQFSDIGIIARNTDCIYGSDLDEFVSNFTHDLIGLRDEDLNALYDIWYGED